MSISYLLQIPGITLVIGKTQSGKSHLLNYIIKNLYFEGYFKFGVVISSTSLFNDEWTCVSKNFHIVPDRAEQYLKSLLIKMAKYKQLKINVPGFIIIDDCLGALKWRDDFWTQIACTIRHYNLSLFITTQYLNKVPSVIRSQCSQYFFLKMLNMRELKSAYEQCFSMFFKFNDFIKFVAENTKYYNAIYVNNHSLNNDDIIKIIQAPPRIAKWVMY